MTSNENAPRIEPGVLGAANVLGKQLRPGQGSGLSFGPWGLDFLRLSRFLFRGVEVSGQGVARKSMHPRSQALPMQSKACASLRKPSQALRLV